MKLMNARKIHFIAIGGIGVSALAQLCYSLGISVSGSDLSESEITQVLQKKYAIPITIGSNPKNISSDIDLIIHSPAVSKTDLEYIRAVELGIPVLSYPEALGQISQDKKTIAISGTNGKTTTTSMIVESLKHLGIEPTVIIGGILQKYGTNFLAGSSEYFITEACEYKRSFLNIHHDIAVITNISEDHLDYFSDLSDIQSAFMEFIDNKKGAGVIVCNTQLPNLQTIINYAKENNVTICDYSKYLSADYQLQLPGEHNRENMAAALATIEALGFDVHKVYNYLSKDFLGTKRRMEFIGKTKDGALIYDDYAHNPEGISYLLNGLRKSFPEKKIIALFEPHLYSRTEDFKDSFARELSKFDELYLFPVYKAREKYQAEKEFLLYPLINMRPENYSIVNDRENFSSYFLNKKYDDTYLIVTIGAGDIWKIGKKLKKQD